MSACAGEGKVRRDKGECECGGRVSVWKHREGVSSSVEKEMRCSDMYHELPPSPVSVVPVAVEAQQLSVVVEELSQGVQLLVGPQWLHCSHQLCREQTI